MFKKILTLIFCSLPLYQLIHGLDPVLEDESFWRISVPLFPVFMYFTLNESEYLDKTPLFFYQNVS